MLFYAVNEKRKLTPQPPEGGVEYKPNCNSKNNVVKSSQGIPASRRAGRGTNLCPRQRICIPDSIKENLQPFFTHASRRGKEQALDFPIELRYCKRRMVGSLLVESKWEGSRIGV